MPPGSGGEAGLDLVEDQQRAGGVHQIADGGEIAVVGRDDAGVHHHRFEDHRGDPPAVLGERAGHRVGVVERHHDHEIADRRRDAGVAGTPVGCSRGPTSSASGSTDTCTESWWP